MAEEIVEIPLRLKETEAEALAQMVKRFTWEDAVRFSNDFDGGKERDEILDAVFELMRALREAGFAPR